MNRMEFDGCRGLFSRKVCAALLKNLRGCFDFAILSGPQSFQTQIAAVDTLQGTNISPQNGILKMIFLFPRWDMLIPWRVSIG